ncbi:hypothetical protein L7F22_046704 [Adiantum nelumboides]|nr:hypothetical protein [Adiantum nelumboides]
MNFIFDLPKTPTGYDGIWTIICGFNKQAHFLPVRKKIKSEHKVKLFMYNIVKYHGMPQSIVSDRDPHGQSEEANSTVLDLLKCYVLEHKATWEYYLLLVDYAYNNIVHTSTSKAPFEIMEGGKKVKSCPFANKGQDIQGRLVCAKWYVQNVDEAYKKIKIALEKTRSKQKKAADCHRRELVFSLGDWVFLRSEKVRLSKMKGKERLFPKSGIRNYGPFQVCNKISDVAYKLKLREGWKLHNAFYIMAHKETKVRGEVARRYLVKFKKYSPMDAKWMEEAELTDEDFQTYIHKTMDIESENLKISEEIKTLTQEEEGYQVGIILQEARLQSLALLAENSQQYLVQEQKDILCMEDAVKQTNSKIQNKREDFMSFCSYFQKDVENLTLQRQNVLLEKNTLDEQIANLNTLLASTEVSQNSLLHEKTQSHQQLTSGNQGLSAQLQECAVKNEKIIGEIEAHNKSLRELNASCNQMSLEIEENEDAIRQFKDFVMGLQMRLSNLMGELNLTSF